MRGASIQIGAGALLAGIIGFWNDAAAFGFLVAVGVILLAHGIYDDFIKPRFRVDQRLVDWFVRRGWTARLETKSQFDFLIHLTSPSSNKEVIVSRDRRARDDVLAFGGRVGLDPRWLPHLIAMSGVEQRRLIQEITIFVATKDIAFDLSDDPRDPNAPVRWPPTHIVVQTALAQDHTLSQHSVDLAAKSIEHSMIGIRALIRKAVLESTGTNPGAEHSDEDDSETPPPPPVGQ